MAEISTPELRRRLAALDPPIVLRETRSILYWARQAEVEPVRVVQNPPEHPGWPRLAYWQEEAVAAIAAVWHPNKSERTRAARRARLEQ